RSASSQVRLLRSFWEEHLRPIEDDDPFADRERRARAALAQTLTALEAVHAAYDDVEWTIQDLAPAVRRWIEEQTFTTAARGSGVHLVDDKAARYGDFDDVWIVGLVDPEWPARPRRHIFYRPGLLKSVGWPSEKDRRGAADAHFLDLLHAASRRTALSLFTLDDDALVSRSMQLDELPRARMSRVQATRGPTGGSRAVEPRVFVDEGLSLEPVRLDALDANARAWADLRLSRTPADEARFHGVTGA